MSKMLGRILVVLAAMTLGSMLWADPIIPTLYNTGVDNNHVVLVNGAQDTHYSVTPPVGGTPYALTAASAPSGWVGDNTTSRWLRPGTVTDYTAGSTTTYLTTFDMTGLNLSTAKITGQWLTDNEGWGIRLNGVNIESLGAGSYRQLGTNYATWTAFGIFSGFDQHVNTLEFVVRNTGSSASPTGLRVEMSGTAAVPDGGVTLMLLGGALVGLETLRRKFRG